mmetsp:Transcript_8763/g.13904  ORF Transcript_8763/g.13904 Transcript_8763/m.13904 type:complete len:135 (+) Transcript_8763:256-660(+)
MAGTWINYLTVWERRNSSQSLACPGRAERNQSLRCHSDSVLAANVDHANYRGGSILSRHNLITATSNTSRNFFCECGRTFIASSSTQGPWAETRTSYLESEVQHLLRLCEPPSQTTYHPSSAGSMPVLDLSLLP